MQILLLGYFAIPYRSNPFHSIPVLIPIQQLETSKCKFFQTRIEFLGHVVTSTGISPTKQRVDNVLQTPAPKTESELKSFLGLITYNAKFILSV